MDDNERWADEVLRGRAKPIPAPAGFTDRVMARVAEAAVEPRPVPTWLLAASDPIAAVGLTIAVVLALLASWWPERLIAGVALVDRWAWNAGARFVQDLDPTLLVTLAAMAALLLLAIVWRTWRVTERAVILALTGRRGS